MTKEKTLLLYLLRDPGFEQAALVRANTLPEASMALYNRTKILVVVMNDYGWVPFPENRQHSNEEKCPVPYWEFAMYVRGPSELKCLERSIQLLSERRAPQGLGKVSLGPQLARSTPLTLRSIRGIQVVGEVQVSHFGYNAPYFIDGIQLVDALEDPASITIGKNILLKVEAEGGVQHVRVGDNIKVRVKSTDDDYFVTGAVVASSIIINVIGIEESNTYIKESSS